MKVSIDGIITIEMPNDCLNIKDIVDYINVNNAEKICIMENEDDISDNKYDLSFLNNIERPEDIAEFSIFVNFKDITPIYRFVNLQALNISTTNGELIDLSKFTKLLKLSTCNLYIFANIDKSSVKRLCYGNNLQDVDCELELLQQFSKLKELRFLRVNDFPISQLSRLKALKKLRFTSCGIESLSGIKEIQSLDFLYLDNCDVIFKIEELNEMPNLEVVWFESCCNLTDISIIKHIKSLRVLMLEGIKGNDFTFLESMDCKEKLECLSLENCGDIKSIRFLYNYPKLQAFDCFLTNVIDGDITPCMGLESVWISDMKHYNLKASQLPFGRDFYKWI